VEPLTAAQQLKQRRAEALKQKATEAQLRNEAKLAKRLLKKPTTKLVNKEATVEAIELPLLENRAPAAHSRRARNIKPPERFNN